MKQSYLCYFIARGYKVAWRDLGGSNTNDTDVNKSIRDLRWGNLPEQTVSELEIEVGDTEQIALMCRFGLPAGLSDKLLNSIRWLRLSEISEDHWTE